MSLFRNAAQPLGRTDWLVRVRTVDTDGRKRAMANGVKFGRKPSDHQRNEAIKRRDAGETLAAIAQSYGVSIAMISRL